MGNFILTWNKTIYLDQTYTKCEEKIFEPLEFFPKLSVLKWDNSDAMLYKSIVDARALSLPLHKRVSQVVAMETNRNH